MSRIMASGREPSSRTPFQCALFMCQAPVISRWAARSCPARAGSHFRLTDQSLGSMADSANIFASRRAPPATAARTLNTEVSGPKGKSSKAPGKLRQISRSAATSMARAYPAVRASLTCCAHIPDAVQSFGGGAVDFVVAHDPGLEHSRVVRGDGPGVPPVPVQRL